MGEPWLPGIPGLVEQAKARRLVLYIGAGVSAAPPTNGPMGASVADRLRPAAATKLGCAVEDLQDDTLEELASKIATLGDEALADLRLRAAVAYDFAGLEPNFGHRVIALLMREGLVKAITVNWDRAVEHAGVQCGVRISGVTSVLQAQSLTTELPLFKVHGCSSVPQSLKITREEVDSPQQWAIAEVQSALTSGTLVFAGLATVGDYVSDPIAQTLSDWADYASAIRVAGPDMPPAWAALLGRHANFSHFPATSDVFFDDLLRAVMADCLARVTARSQNLAALEPWAAPMAIGAEAIEAAVQQSPAHLLLAWWRDGVTPTASGVPFVTEVPGQNAMMTVALLAGLDASVEVSGRGRRFRVRTPHQYVEVLSRPGAHLSEIMPIGRDRATRRWDDGAYEDASPVTFVVVNAVGSFPAYQAVPDIAGEDDVENDIGADLCGPVRFVSAEDGVQGRLAG